MSPYSQKILSYIERTLDIDLDDLISPKRTGKLVIARVIFTHLHRMLYASSWTDIGSWLNRDHATIMYYGKMHLNFTSTKDAKYMRAYSAVTEMMQLETAIEFKKQKATEALEWLRNHHDHPDFNIILGDRNQYRQEIDELEMRMKSLTIKTIS